LIGECSGMPFRMQGGGGKRILGGRITSCKQNRIVGNIFYAAKKLPHIKDPQNVSDNNLFIHPSGDESFDLTKWREDSGWDSHSRQAIANFEFDRNTWTLRQNPIVKCPLVPREQTITCDYFDTPTADKMIPLGPFAKSNNKPVVPLRQTLE